MWRCDRVLPNTFPSVVRRCALPFLLLPLATACHDDTPDAVEDVSASHTVLVYMAAENTLYSYVANDVAEMLASKTALTDNDHLIIYIDDTAYPRVYEVGRSTTAEKLGQLTPAKAFDAELNSASSSTLGELLAYTRENYPADDYSVVLWSHATGWLPAATDEGVGAKIFRGVPARRTFGVDNGKNDGYANSGSQMDIADMAQVLKTYAPFRCLFFDACFMQSLEVAYELRDCADCMVGSPAEIPGPGAPYDKMLPYLFADDFDGDAMAGAYNDYYKATRYGSMYYGGVMSCVHLGRMDDFASQFRPLFLQYLDSLRQLDYSDRLNYFDYDRYGTKLCIPDCYDIKGVMRRVLLGGQTSDAGESKLPRGGAETPTRGSRNSHAGEPKLPRGGAGTPTRGSRNSHAGEPKLPRGGAGTASRGSRNCLAGELELPRGGAETPTRGSRNCYAGKPELPRGGAGTATRGSGISFEEWEETLESLCTVRHDTFWYSSYMGNSAVDDEQCSGLSFYVPLPKYAERGDDFDSSFLQTAWGKYLCSEE